MKLTKLSAAPTRAASGARRRCRRMPAPASIGRGHRFAAYPRCSTPAVGVKHEAAAVPGVDTARWFNVRTKQAAPLHQTGGARSTCNPRRSSAPCSKQAPSARPAQRKTLPVGRPCGVPRLGSHPEADLHSGAALRGSLTETRAVPRPAGRGGIHGRSESAVRSGRSEVGQR